MPGLDDPLSHARCAAILRRALSRPTTPPGEGRVALDVTSAPDVQGNPAKNTAGPDIGQGRQTTPNPT